MSKTVVVQLGNSDNKLTQAEWAMFAAYVRDAIGANSINIHFDGGSKHDAPWQSATLCSFNWELVVRIRGQISCHACGSWPLIVSGEGNGQIRSVVCC